MKDVYVVKEVIFKDGEFFETGFTTYMLSQTSVIYFLCHEAMAEVYEYWTNRRIEGKYIGLIEYRTYFRVRFSHPEVFPAGSQPTQDRIFLVEKHPIFIDWE